MPPVTEGVAGVACSILKGMAPTVKVHNQWIAQALSLIHISSAPVAPEVITGLTNIDQVFAHFLPEIDIEFTDAEGAPVEAVSYTHLDVYKRQEYSRLIHSVRPDPLPDFFLCTALH